MSSSTTSAPMDRASSTLPSVGIRIDVDHRQAAPDQRTQAAAQPFAFIAANGHDSQVAHVLSTFERYFLPLTGWPGQGQERYAAFRSPETAAAFANSSASFLTSMTALCRSATRAAPARPIASSSAVPAVRAAAIAATSGSTAPAGTSQPLLARLDQLRDARDMTY